MAMIRTRAMLGLLTAGLLLGLAGAGGAQGPATEARPVVGPGFTLHLLKEDYAFCLDLSARFGALRKDLRSIPDEAIALAREGERMCGQGSVKPGITRLKHALWLVREMDRAPTVMDSAPRLRLLPP